MLKRFFNRMTDKLFFLSFVLIFFSCESDPVSVDSSFSNNNSFFIETFEVNTEQSYTFQDDSLFNGRSYRLYSGNIDDINSKIFMKINTSYLTDSKYCQVDTASYSDSTIHSVDSLQIVFRSFDEIMDEDSLLLLDTTMLDIVGGFGIIPNWNEDSLHIFSSLEEPMDLTSIIDSSMQIENYTFSLNLPFNDDWCTSVGPRRFRDDRGEVWFLGIASADAGKSSASKTKARESSLQFSRFEAAMAVFSDVEAFRGADRVVQTVAGDDPDSASTEGLETLGAYLRAELRDREIAGLSTKLSTSCVHPISGKKLIVTISGLNQEAAMTALRQREGSYVTAVLDGTHQQIMKGTQAGQSSAVTKARTDSTPSAVAEEAAVERIQQGVETELSKADPQVAQESDDGTASDADCASDCPDQGQAQSGTFSGAGQSDTDW